MAQLAQISSPSAPMHAGMIEFSALTSELLFGEVVEILSDEGHWCKVRNARDSYEGYILSASLTDTILQPTHKVTRPHIHVYEIPDFKTYPLNHLPFMGLVTVTDEAQNGFIKLATGGWVPKSSLTLLEDVQTDFVKSAEIFLGMPYLWGGRTDQGLDCSALVQLAIINAGMECPRDSKDQIDAFKNEIDFSNAYTPAGLKRGDLVFMEGHIGLMIDETNFLNATSRTMNVCIENIHDAANAYPGGIIAVKRIG